MGRRHHPRHLWAALLLALLPLPPLAAQEGSLPPTVASPATNPNGKEPAKPATLRPQEGGRATPATPPAPAGGSTPAEATPGSTPVTTPDDARLATSAPSKPAIPVDLGLTIRPAGEGQAPARVALSGPLRDLLPLQKAVLFGLLKELGIERANLPQTVRLALTRPHTADPAALAAYAEGVAQQDHDQPGAARAAFRLAAKQDPAFQAARERELATPYHTPSLDALAREMVAKARQEAQRRLAAPNPLPPRETPSPREMPTPPADDAAFLASFEAGRQQAERLTRAAGELAGDARNDPSLLPARLYQAIGGGVDPEIALDTALVALGHHAPEAPPAALLDKLLAVAVAGGLDPAAAREVVSRLRQEQGCR